MLKKSLIFVGIALVFLALDAEAGRNYRADIADNDACEEKLLQRAGGDQPFPLGAVNKLPWAQIEGDWKTIGPIGFRIKMKVVRETESGTKFVAISWVDTNTGASLAHGVAQVRRNDKVVRSFLSGVGGEARLSLALRDLLPEDIECTGRQVFVINLRLTNEKGVETIKKTMVMKKDARTLIHFEE